MKVISLLQPWASLVAKGNKHIETRSWATRHRGKLAIHASAKLAKAQLLLASQNDYFLKALRLEPHRTMEYYQSKLPTGKILAVTDLVDCIQIPEPAGSCLYLHGEEMETCLEVPSDEYAFGDFGPGRYAWILQDIRRLPVPIPAKGHLGLWDFAVDG